VDAATYELDQDTLLPVDAEDLARCPEPLFASHVTNSDHPLSAQIAAVEAKMEPGEKIVLAGPFAHFPGVLDRFRHLVRTPESVVLSPPDAAWIGGSMLALHPSFDARCFTRAELEEEGIAAVHTRCPFGEFDTSLLGGSMVKAARG
jgi:Actin